jgi:hypothetical protein
VAQKCQNQVRLKMRGFMSAGPRPSLLQLLTGDEEFAFKSLFHARMLFPAC